MESMKFSWDLEEEILCRLPAKSLVRLRTVCKHWNGLLNDKRFVDKHLGHARPQFILLTESKEIYSIDVDLGRTTIEVRELASVFPCEAVNLRHTTISVCDGLLFRGFWRQGVAVWNPWLTQLAWIEYVDKRFWYFGVGYVTSRSEKVYKILGSFTCFRKVSAMCEEAYDRFAIYECASHALKFIDDPYDRRPLVVPFTVNGNLYWDDYNPKTREHSIRSFDFSKEIFKPLGLLPCQMNLSPNIKFVLAVFKGDRLSLLKQCFETTKVEIWVTKKKIDIEEQVVWIKFITFPTTNLPKLINKFDGISYIIVEKTIIMSCSDAEDRAACIYIVRGDMFKQFQVGSELGRFSQCLYLPNFTSVPLEFRLHQV